MENKKFDYGNKVFIVDYVDGKTDGICGMIFIGNNDKYAFLSPTLETRNSVIEKVDDLCQHYFMEWATDGDLSDIVVYPLRDCFATRAEAEELLVELESKGL